MIIRPADQAEAKAIEASMNIVSPVTGSTIIAASKSMLAVIAPEMPSASGPVSVFAKRVKAPRRSISSPVCRCEKNDNGSDSKWARKRASPDVMVQNSTATNNFRRKAMLSI